MSGSSQTAKGFAVWLVDGLDRSGQFNRSQLDLVEITVEALLELVIRRKTIEESAAKP